MSIQFRPVMRARDPASRTFDISPNTQRGDHSLWPRDRSQYVNHVAASRFLCAGLVIASFVAASGSAAATYTKIYSFCTQANCADGGFPRDTVTIDASGNLYGVTTEGGGRAGEGAVFALLKTGSTYTYQKIHAFCSHKRSCGDGGSPSGPLILDVSGSLYGVANTFGKFGGGVAYELTPDAEKSVWTYKVLYDFCSKANCTDGKSPAFALTYVGASSGLPYDGTSPLFGTAGAGKYGAGVAYQLTLVPGKTRRKEHVIYNFCARANCDDGGAPFGLIADANGNLFGAGYSGGANFGGVLFKLAPNQKGGFKETVLYTFCSQANCADGDNPLGGLTFGPDGALNGTTQQGGANKVGSVFSFLPSTSKLTVLYSFCSLANCTDGEDPLSGVAVDADGVNYGNTPYGGENASGIAYAIKNGSENVLKHFCEDQDCADGSLPIGGITLDGSGNAFGTTQEGGDNNAGVVFEITP